MSIWRWLTGSRPNRHRRRRLVASRSLMRQRRKYRRTWRRWDKSYTKKLFRRDVQAVPWPRLVKRVGPTSII